ncbi:hypothetical protein DSO57_1036404 [Entomophthora muscae]|uniref:Uncharacterized protein n=1 Tax=Entomophthora muscae TaxID=34485 RepID=A0ACC2S1C9_9FUNG|nr:hypothetical protein DSO57_1036404 [Entomophthora muscae]
MEPPSEPVPQGFTYIQKQQPQIFQSDGLTLETPHPSHKKELRLDLETIRRQDVPAGSTSRNSPLKGYR